MAYVKVMASAVAARSLRYGEHERGCIKSGVDCPNDTETAIKMMAADRAVWQKRGGVQSYIVIQSFDPNDAITPEEANRRGVELLQKLAPGHRGMVYTHTQSKGGKLHNHIVFNSVNSLDGKKFESHGLLYKARAISDELCLANNLSVMLDNKKAPVKYHQAELGLMEKGKVPWKDKIRLAVERAATASKSLDEFRKNLEAQGVTMSVRTRKRDGHQAITYHNEHGARVRSEKLGTDYTAENIVRVLNENVRREKAERAKAAADDRARAHVHHGAMGAMQAEGLTLEKFASCIVERFGFVRHAVGGKPLATKERNMLKRAFQKAIKAGKIEKYDFEVSRDGGRATASGGGGGAPEVRLRDDRERDERGAVAAAGQLGHNDDRELWDEFRHLSKMMQDELEMKEFMREVFG